MAAVQRSARYWSSATAMLWPWTEPIEYEVAAALPKFHGLERDSGTV
jgi:hypothetical protein